MSKTPFSLDKRLRRTLKPLLFRFRFERYLQVFRYAECYIFLKICITLKAFKRRHRMVCVQGPNSKNILLLTILAGEHTPCLAGPLIKIERPQADGCWGTNMQNYAKTILKLCENAVKTNPHKNSPKTMRELCKKLCKKHKKLCENFAKM